VLFGNLIVPLPNNMIQNMKMEAASLFETCVTIYRRDVISEKMRVYKSKCIIHSFSILSDDRSKASSKTMPPYSAMQSLLLQMRISSPVLKIISV